MAYEDEYENLTHAEGPEYFSPVDQSPVTAAAKAAALPDNPQLDRLQTQQQLLDANRPVQDPNKDIPNLNWRQRFDLWLGYEGHVTKNENARRLQALKIESQRVGITNSTYQGALALLKEGKSLPDNMRQQFFKAASNTYISRNPELSTIFSAATKGYPTQAEIAIRQGIINNKLGLQQDFIMDPLLGESREPQDQDFLEALSTKVGETTFEELTILQNDLAKDPEFGSAALSEDDMNFIAQYPQGVQRIGFTNVQSPAQTVREKAISGEAAARTRGSLEESARLGEVAQTEEVKTDRGTLVTRYIDRLGNLIKEHEELRNLTSSEFRSEMAKIKADIPVKIPALKSISPEQAQEYLDLSDDMLTRIYKEAKAKSQAASGKVPETAEGLVDLAKRLFAGRHTRAAITTAIKNHAVWSKLSKTDQAKVIKELNALKK